MPTTYGTYTKQVKLLPLALHSDGSASISVRWGFQPENGEWAPFGEQQFQIPADDVSAILDATPREGLTRRDDLSLCVYEYLVSKKKIEAGEIS